MASSFYMLRAALATGEMPGPHRPRVVPADRSADVPVTQVSVIRALAGAKMSVKDIRAVWAALQTEARPCDARPATVVRFRWSDAVGLATTSFSEL
jgi:hypothetical protein